MAKDDIKELEDKMKRTYAPSLVYKENKNRYIFLPENNITMNSEVYYTSMRHLDIEKYKEALLTTQTMHGKKRLQTEMSTLKVQK